MLVTQVVLELGGVLDSGVAGAEWDELEVGQVGDRRRREGAQLEEQPVLVIQLDCLCF